MPNPIPRLDPVIIAVWPDKTDIQLTFSIPEPMKTVIGKSFRKANKERSMLSNRAY